MNEPFLKSMISSQKWNQIAKNIWLWLPHPSLFIFSSTFLVIFAHIDKAASVKPLPAVVLAQNSPAPTPLSSQINPVEFNIEDPQNTSWILFKPSWVKKASWSSFANGDMPIDPVSDPTWNSEALVQDPSDRIEKEFRVTPVMEKRVIFWMNVFARYTSQIRVVHDKANVGIVYGYIDLRPVYRQMGNTRAADSKAYKVEMAVLKRLKNNFLAASGIIKNISISPEERNTYREFLSQVGSLEAKDAAALVSRIRTQTGQRDMFLSALHRSKNLLPHIESVFKRNNLPVALARIPFVESSFNSNAQSKIGAVGIWQFTPETARDMIHVENEQLWADPIRQTQSAARLLRMYRSILPDWGTTVTSYNSGVGRLKRLCEKHGAKTIEQLISNEALEGLGFAGKNFYAEFLAVNIIEAYKEEIFEHRISIENTGLVFKGKNVFPSQSCDL